MSLDLFSQPFPPSGGMHADAAKRALGRPPLDPWALFLRETLQNSWDARLETSDSISFSVDYRWLSPSQTSYLRSQVFGQLPARGLDLSAVLDEPDIALLTVSDSGTRGLTGPTRADVHVEGRTDFVDFARNIGRASDKEIGGGTYGFGKGVLFEASAAATIIVFTRTHDEFGAPVSRLISIGVGDNYELNGAQYTGRHLWGLRHEETGVEPLIGSAAEAMAARLGMTRLGPEGTGTVVAVVAPVAHEGAEANDKDIINRISRAAVEWAWPHMVDRTIRFAFTYEGRDVPYRDPVQDPILSRYVEAYEAAKRTAGGQGTEISSRLRVTTLRSQRPARLLGRLATRYFTAPTDDLVTLVRPNAVALMRKPRMIVRYLEVSPDPNGRGLAAVFIADDARDEDFASAEPVAHDDWQPNSVRFAKGEHNPVKYALNGIKEEYKNQSKTLLAGSTDAASAAVPQLATMLGSLLQPAPGGDASVPAADKSARKAASTGPRRASAGRSSIDGRPRLQLEAGRVLAVFTVNLRGDWKVEEKLVAEAKVVLADGRTESPGDAPLRGENPEIFDWRSEDGSLLATGPELDRLTERSTAVSVRVVQPRDTAVTLSVRREQ